MLNPVAAVLNTKIRNKLIIMCICVIVPVLVAASYLVFGMSNTVQENIVSEAYTEAASIAAQTKVALYNATIAAERVYGGAEFDYLFSNEFADEAEYLDYYENNDPVSYYLNANPQFKSIAFYIDKSGFVYNGDFRQATDEIKSFGWYKSAASSNEARWHLVQSAADAAAPEEAEEAEEKDVLEDGEANEDETDSESDAGELTAPAWYLSYLRALYDEAGNNIGVMAIALDPEWLETIMKDEPSSVVFTVGGDAVFYSNIADIAVGSVIYVGGDMFKQGASDTVDISDEEYKLTKRGFTIVSYFDYENTGNLFQIYLVKPYSLITGRAGEVMVNFLWYMLLCALLSILLTFLFSSFFSRRIKFLKDEMHAVAKGDFSMEKGIRGTDEIFDLYTDLKRMVDSMQVLINEAYEARLQAEALKLSQIEAEFKTLASQINPHFLYNTLETIRMKAYTGGDRETAGLVKQLGKFMRRCLEVKDSVVTLESELEFTSGYLEIQKARFGKRVTYSLYCEVDKNYKILPLVIQPIVENAFVHGVERVKSNGNIKIKIYYKMDKVIIDVSDNGQGMSEEKLSILQAKLTVNDTSSGKSIGLTNVNRRIKIYHGDNCGLSVSSSEGKGTRVRLTLPRESADKKPLAEIPGPS